MSQIKIEPFDSSKHPNHMWDVGKIALKSQRHQNAPTLAPYHVCVLTVCNFTFIFHDLAQLDACREYYSREIHPSSRLPVYSESKIEPSRGFPAHIVNNGAGDHWEYLRWFEKLPQYLLEKSKRLRVLTALEKARAIYVKFGG